MEKYICFIHLDILNKHTTTDSVTKKNLYNFARMISLSYDIYSYKDNKYKLITQVRSYVKPQWIILPDNFNNTIEINNLKETPIYEILTKFKADINNVNIIIGYNIDDQLKSLFAEILRYNVLIGLYNNLIIDINTFSHSYTSCDIYDLYKYIFADNTSENYINMDKIKLIKKCFISLYENFSK